MGYRARTPKMQENQQGQENTQDPLATEWKEEAGEEEDKGGNSRRT